MIRYDTEYLAFAEKLTYGQLNVLHGTPVAEKLGKEPKKKQKLEMWANAQRDGRPA